MADQKISKFYNIFISIHKYSYSDGWDDWCIFLSHFLIPKWVFQNSISQLAEEMGKGCAEIRWW